MSRLARMFLPALAAATAGCEESLWSVTYNQYGVEVQQEDRGIPVAIDTVPSPYPYSVGSTPFGPNTTFSTISAGWHHVCAVRLDGGMECRGRDFEGETHPPEGTWTSVYAGYKGTCGVHTNGTVECWGFSDAYVDWARPSGADWPTGMTFNSFSVGRWGICGVNTSNDAVCWGSDGFYPDPAPNLDFTKVSTGYGVTCGKVSGSSSVECWSTDNNAIYDPPEGTWQDVSVSEWTVCGVRTDGSLDCWGSSKPAFFDRLPPDHDFASVQVKGGYVCGLKTNGTAACYSAVKDQWEYMQGTYVQLAVGQGFACGRSSTGYISCWGRLPQPLPI